MRTGKPIVNHTWMCRSAARVSGRIKSAGVLSGHKCPHIIVVKVMNKCLAILGTFAMSVLLAASSAIAADGYLKKDQPQAEASQGDGLFPGGHGGGGFGVSENTHGANGNADPSGTNGNQGSDNANAHANNADRGNAGGPGGGCQGDCGGGGDGGGGQ